MKDVITTLLNTIIYHRALGPIKILYENCLILNKITYVFFIIQTEKDEMRRTKS